LDKLVAILTSLGSIGRVFTIFMFPASVFTNVEHHLGREELDHHLPRSHGHNFALHDKKSGMKTDTKSKMFLGKFNLSTIDDLLDFCNGKCVENMFDKFIYV